MSSMKTVLCYGDSNTYGYNPANSLRYPKNVRWTGILQMLLGDDYAVIEEGCNGRTTIYDDPVDGWKNGLYYLKPCLNTHKPVDYVVLMLGTNDLKKCFGLSAKEVASGVERLVDEIYDFSQSKQLWTPQIILVSPAHISEDILTSFFKDTFSADSIEKSMELAVLYEDIALRKGCIFLDAARYAKVSEADGLHLSVEAHRSLAEAIYMCKDK